MFKRMLVKEWKEKSGLFAFAMVALAVFALALFAYSKDKETVDILASTAFLVFLPVFSILLGASGFFTEFQEDAWAYLFSRPVKKGNVWIAKYLSLLTVLYAVVLPFVFLARLHPALKSGVLSFSFRIVGDLSFGVLAYVLPLLLFTTAFSFSILTEKVYNVAFLAASTLIVLQIAVSRACILLFYRTWFSSVFSLVFLLSLLIPLSFALASAITLSRADFSQPRLRSWTFTKRSANFILTSIVLVVLIGFVGGKIMKERYIYSLRARTDALYFVTEKGFFKFDPAAGRTKKMAKSPSFWGDVSMGGDKLAFVHYHFRTKGRDFAELRVMNTDGTEEKVLVGTENPESPFYGVYFGSLWASPKGELVAFIDLNSRNKATRKNLWTIKSNGTGLRGYDLGIPDVYYEYILGFADSDRALLLLCVARAKDVDANGRQVARLLRLDLESEQVETLAEVRKTWFAFMPAARETSLTERLAFIQYNEATAGEYLAVYDPEAREIALVYYEDSVKGFRWNKAGDKLAFLTAGSKLGIYSPAEKQVVKMAELKGYDLRWPSQALEWTSDDRLILRRVEGEGASMCILDANFREQKALRLPFNTYYASRFWSAGKYAIVENTEKHELWGADLTTDKWIRIY